MQVGSTEAAIFSSSTMPATGSLDFRKYPKHFSEDSFAKTLRSIPRKPQAIFGSAFPITGCRGRAELSKSHLPNPFKLGLMLWEVFAALTYLLMCLCQDGEDVVNFLKSSSPMIAVLSCCHVNTSAQAEESRRWVSMGGR